MADHNLPEVQPDPVENSIELVLEQISQIYKNAEEIALALGIPEAMNMIVAVMLRQLFELMIRRGG